MVDEENVREQLKEVIDPELNINIVDLGLVYEIDIDDKDVFILMTLTSPGCPLHGVFNELVTEEVEKIEEVGDIDIELTFDPRWSPEDMSDKAKNEVGSIPGVPMF